MNPQEPDDPLQRIENPLKVMQPGERVLCEIKRHPFGLLGVYASFAAIVVLAVAGIVLAPQWISGFTSQDQATAALGAVILCTLVGLFMYISVIVYKGNRWIITTDSITQITQVSLFRKRTSELSLASLEDVTVEQNGMMQSMFGFGRLRAETAGERSKFVFDFCPDPSEYAKKIIAAHEAYIASKPDETRTVKRPLADAAAFNQSYEQPQPQYNPVPNQQPLQSAPYNPVRPPARPGPMQPDPTEQPTSAIPSDQNT